MAGSRGARYADQLHSGFDRSAMEEMVFRATGPAGTSWRVAGMTMTVEGTATVELDLSAHTIASLAAAVAAAGLAVSDVVGDPDAALSARRVLDGEWAHGDGSNGAVMAYGSLVWAIGEAIGAELDAARDAGAGALRAAELATAEDEWLDLWCHAFGVVRMVDEPDSALLKRLVAEVGRPRSNGYAIRLVLEEALRQPVSVADVTDLVDSFPRYDAAIEHDGTYSYAQAAGASYGRFDVSIGFDLLGSTTPAAYLDMVTSLVNRLRAAGTSMRSLVLSGSEISDTVSVPVDLMAVSAITAGDIADSVSTASDAGLDAVAQTDFSESIDVGSDAIDLQVFTASFGFDGIWAYDGSITHSVDASSSESF